MKQRLWFLGRFLLYWVAGLTALAVFPSVDDRLALVTAGHLMAVTRWLGLQPALDGTVLYIDDISFNVEPVCTSSAPTVALAAAMLAFPASALWRLAGLALGAAILWGYNLFRLLILALLLRAKSPLLDFFHLYLWQTVTLLFVGICFVSWIRLQRRGVEL